MQLSRDDLKLRVREANNIVDVIGTAVQLKRSGKSYKGLCPFHDEKTPSFHVNAERQTFKCFGCGEGGDVFTFIEKTERVEFKEALSILAERAGIPMEPLTAGAAAEASLVREQRIHLYKAQTIAARFFVAQLRGEDGAPAREYLAKRHLDKQADDWSVGFAPDSWQALTGQYATTQSKERWLVAAGLARERDKGGVYDTFRGRVMFPIADPSGKLVGFGGRILGDGEPKYLNTPETPVFSKGRLLYGIDKARDAIDKKGTALVVEGYTDVIRCHQHGFTNAVATLGTALGTEHVRLLRRFGATKVLVVYDADAPGIKASERALEILIEADMAGAVVNLQGGLDPCDFLDEKPPEAFEAALAKAKDLFEFKIDRATQGIDLGDLNERARVAHELMAVVSLSTDRIKRAMFRQQVAEKVGVAERELEFGNFVPVQNATHVREEVRDEPVGLITRAERDLAWLLLKYPSGIGVVMEDADVQRIADPVAGEVVETIAALHHEHAAVDERAILDQLSPEAVQFAVSVWETKDVSKPEALEGRLSAAASALSLLRIPEQVYEMDRQIKEAEESGDEGRLVALIKERSEILRMRQRLQSRGRSRPNTSSAGSAEEGHDKNAHG